MNTRLDGGVDGGIQGLGLATTQRHVGDGALEALALAVLGSLDLGEVALGGVLNATNHIRHAAGAVGAKDLDGVDAGLLGNTVLLAGNGTGAVSAMAVAVLVGITAGNGLTPLGAALEVDVLGVAASVNHVGVNALAALGSVEVLVEGAKVERLAVGHTSQTPGSLLLGLAIAGILSHGVLSVEGKHGVDNGIALDVLDLELCVSRCFLPRTLLGRGWTYIAAVPDVLDGTVREGAGIATEGSVGSIDTNLVLVLHSGDNVVNDAALAELETALLILVDALQPRVVVGCLESST